MRVVLFRQSGGEVHPGLLTENGVVDVADIIPPERDPHLTMQALIDGFPAAESHLHQAEERSAMPLDAVQLLPPLPRPGKILCCIGNYWEHAQRDPGPLNMFLKNPDAVVGPGGTVRLPEVSEPWMFMHEAELAVVLRGPAKSVPEEEWRRAVFGYTCLVDVSARGQGRYTWKQGSWLGKSFDTFCPLGPCIVTSDEIPDPNDVVVRFWNDGQLRHNYNTDDMEHRVPELVAFASSIMTLNSGDVISCGTNHEGLGPIQDGEHLEIEIERIGRMALRVEDPLKRTWERGIYMGEDSTNPDAVRRHHPGKGRAREGAGEC